MAYSRPTPSSETRCPACTDDGTLFCAGCKNVKYCSRECQQSDWQFHRSLCKSFQSFSSQHRPSPDMRRVIFFPADGKKPEFRWVSVWNVETEQEVDYRPLLGIKSIGERRYIQQDQLLNCDVGKHKQINLVFDDMFFQKYSRPNQAVRWATAGKAGFEWRGPMIAYCGEYDYDGDFPCRMMKAMDMGMRDLSDLVAWLLCYGRERDSDKFRRMGGKVTAVKLNCDGETREFKAPWAETVKVPRLHPAFEGGGEICGISKLVDMPLLFWKYPDKKYKMDERLAKCNLLATWMQLNVDPHSEYFGWAQNWMGGEVPNVLIARADRKPLSEDVLGAFGDFCSDVVQPAFEAALESRSRRRKQAAVDAITPARWNSYLKGKLEEGSDSSLPPSPESMSSSSPT